MTLRLTSVSICLPVLLAFSDGTGHAAQSIGACAFTQPGPGGPLTRGSGQAYQDINSALQALRMGANIAIYQSFSVSNAAAQTTGPNVGQIIYNPQFLGGMYNRNAWAPLSILAHELGHIVGPTAWTSDSWSRELGADFVSGCALKRMGVNYTNATAALRMMFDWYGGPSHPDTPRRLNAMQQGFLQC